MIALDTSPLIWAIQKGNTVETPRIEAFLEDAAVRAIPVLVPTPVLAEFLIKIPPAAHETNLIELAEKFVLAPLDPRGSALAAELEARASAAIKASNSGANWKQRLRIDAMIIAIAVLNGADVLVTNNRKDFVQLAGGRIKILQTASLHTFVFPPLAGARAPTPPPREQLILI